MFSQIFRLKKYSFLIVLSVAVLSGCAVEAAKENNRDATGKNSTTAALLSSTTKNAAPAGSIKIAPDSPADTVRVFYKNLREKRFREAMFLTNLRPAIEKLTDAELKELHVDFEPLAAQVPPEIEINGEIIVQNKATVTAKLPDNDTEELKIQEIKLRQENGAWMILTVDEPAEAEVRREGANYFTALKIKTHHEEAKEMLERVNKAQMVYAMKNAGLYGDAQALMTANLLPKDFSTHETTGYNYQIRLSGDRRKFTATAVPAVYGKTGRLSFWFETSGNKVSTLKNKDTKGQPLKM